MDSSSTPHPTVGTDEPVHLVASREQWPWLPMVGSRVLARHPYCAACGEVKVLGRESGIKMGGLVNLLAALERRLGHDGHRLTEAQKRIIVKKLESVGAHDRFGTPRSGQLRLLAEAVATTTGLARDYLAERLRSC